VATEGACLSMPAAVTLVAAATKAENVAPNSAVAAV
jgi:hypothetical protein